MIEIDAPIPVNNFSTVSINQFFNLPTHMTAILDELIPAGNHLMVFFGHCSFYACV